MRSYLTFSAALLAIASSHQLTQNNNDTTIGPDGPNQYQQEYEEPSASSIENQQPSASSIENQQPSASSIDTAPYGNPTPFQVFGATCVKYFPCTSFQDEQCLATLEDHPLTELVECMNFDSKDAMIQHFESEEPQANDNNGELICENHGYSATQCSEIPCCNYQQGCWSAVGNGPCIDPSAQGDAIGPDGGYQDASATAGGQQIQAEPSTIISQPDAGWGQPDGPGQTIISQPDGGQQQPSASDSTIISQPDGGQQQPIDTSASTIISQPDGGQQQPSASDIIWPDDGQQQDCEYCNQNGGGQQ